MIYGNVFLEAADKSSSLYFISEKKNLKELKPRVPNNYFTKNGFEDGTTARVCFAKSVAKSLMALSYSCAGKIFYVYQPAKEYMTYKPTTKEVPDCKITGEIWIREPVELKCIGKIKCIKDAGKPGHKFKYGNNTAELYDWEYEWLERKSLSESADLDFNYKAYDINSTVGRSYILKDNYTKKYVDYLSENTGEIYVDTDNNKMIGYIFVGKKKDKGFISTLEVAKSYRGLGFGKRLLLDAVKKYDAVDLVVYKDNKIALNLYKKYGFVIIGEAKNNKAWWMKLKSKLTKEDKNHVIKESSNQSSLDKQFKKKSGKSFNIIDINNINAIKYMKQDDILSKNLDYIDKHRVGEIAVCDGDLAGYIFVTKSGEIQPIHIFEEYRGYGLSNTLMQDGITKYGAKKLGVYSDNLVAIKLYKKFGFKVVGNKVYKDGSEILFMERK